jgi:uncharacterized MAPEG superfamily protein
MGAYHSVAIVTLLSLLLYSWMGMQVSKAHRKAGLHPPAMVGDPLLERTSRAHLNTLESLPVFLPSLWLFAIYWNVTAATALGCLWLAGRLIYFLGYVASPEKRLPGFAIQAVAVLSLTLGALGRIIYLIVLQ